MTLPQTNQKQQTDKLPQTEDNIDDKLANEIDISFFPSNIFYKLLGVEFILTKHKLNPDPIMMPLYEEFAEEILDPQEAFNLKKDENIYLEITDLEPH